MRLWFIQTGCKHVWIWMAIEPIHKSVLGNISEEGNMFVQKISSDRLSPNMINI